MVEIRISLCSTAIPHAGCSSYLCLKDLMECEIEFMEDKDNGKVKTIGIMNCSGCQPKKSLHKCFDSISSFEAAMIDTVILSPCVLAVCPFIKELRKAVQEKLLETEFGKKAHRCPLGITVLLVPHAFLLHKGSHRPCAVSRMRLCDQTLPL